LAQGDDLGMRGRIVPADGLIESLANDLVAHNDNSTNRHLIVTRGYACQVKGCAHVELVVNHDGRALKWRSFMLQAFVPLCAGPS
jgi:hypothetical protein